MRAQDSLSLRVILNHSFLWRSILACQISFLVFGGFVHRGFTLRAKCCQGFTGHLNCYLLALLSGLLLAVFGKVTSIWERCQGQI